MAERPRSGATRTSRDGERRVAEHPCSGAARTSGTVEHRVAERSRSGAARDAGDGERRVAERSRSGTARASGDGERRVAERSRSWTTRAAGNGERRMAAPERERTAAAALSPGRHLSASLSAEHAPSETAGEQYGGRLHGPGDRFYIIELLLLPGGLHHQLRAGYGGPGSGDHLEKGTALLCFCHRRAGPFDPGDLREPVHLRLLYTDLPDVEGSGILRPF